MAKIIQREWTASMVRSSERPSPARSRINPGRGAWDLVRSQ
jgi:hypothetical protein